ncbi:MAG: glycoside hydrolase family 65 protein [Betaproteobacteria bacterium]|nr:glycoside hydrolase family 65 protein [Betaproteobacteria bacterium]MDH5220904.1 glycoside hydrolase family 65 protein [Betaproteobacteria bacterium]MDH5352408.1 glycoside hydrolase family 65 protein [Betaproteobacteria bacterium]
MPWRLEYREFRPAEERLREALCTLGNGYFATRGAAPEAAAGEFHYPGTYLAGGYDRQTTEIAGRRVENEDLVNLPNWLALGFRIDGSAWFDLKAVEILEYRQALDLESGMLERHVRFRDAAGRRTLLADRRLVHMAEPHLAALETEITAEDWRGPLEVRSALDGRVENAGVPRYRDLARRHLEPLEASAAGADALFLRMRTLQSRLEIAMAARTRLDHPAQVRDVIEPGYAGRSLHAELAEGETLRIEKVVALYTSRDRAISECGAAARAAVARAPEFAALAAGHSLAWQQLWRRFDMALQDGGERTQRILRLHVFHLLQTASPNTIGLDAGVPARGLHGEAYRGHIFWDELFIFPLLNLRLPEVTRALLLYRYRRLREARENAHAAGYRGAMYPWQSGSSGREESQVLHLNPRSGRWIPDHTYLQRHVNAAIAHNIWQYWQVTRDLEFLSHYGAEMFLEIARFWGSFATYNETHARYEILGVVGPDEFHTADPDAGRPGLDNHAYTNVMAAWVLARAADVLAALPEERRAELRETLALGDEELARWDDASRRMRVAFHGEGVISQFEGYEKLEELDWQGYREKYRDLSRLDRILEAEGDDVNRYQASKQADVLMLFYLFSAEELQELFGRLGYPFPADTIPKNVAYYSARTTHGSTLSRVVNSWVLARADREGSWRFFQEALESDVADIQGGTTAEGIHLGAMAGTVDLLQRGYTGIVTQGDVLWLNPCLPKELDCLRVSVRYRGLTLDLDVRHERLRVHARASNAAPIALGVVDKVHRLAAGEAREFAL